MSTNTKSKPEPYPVNVHSYLPSFSLTPSTPARPVQTYEHLLPSSPGSPPPHPEPENALVFIGGLGDGPHTVPYVRKLAARLASLRYAVFEARLSSAFTGYGYGSLAQDVREMADLVRYLRRELGKKSVVLMGHSTGCQDCLEYAAKWKECCRNVGGNGGKEEEEEVRVDGFILQGPVSDREAILMGEDKGEVEESLRVAEGLVREGRGAEVMRQAAMPAGWRSSPVTAYRWWSLAGVGGDDDYFSSDLPDEKLAAIWGKLEQPVLILPSEKDEWVPSEIDVIGLVNRWKSFCKPGVASALSGLIPGADHRVEEAAAQEWLADRVATFLTEVEK
ncbi:hypothetical protein VTK56DRAFT_8243 [Thermocarpiscus australiensis]